MKNLFAATYAPMTKAGKLNTGIIKDYSEFLSHNKVFGVFINGSTGDFVSLGIEERNELLEKWASEKPSELYLINHVGSNNLREAQAMAEFSADKADAVAAIAPFYFVPGSIDLLLDYCAGIAEKAPNLPFFYYHLPALTGVNFDMTRFSGLAKSRIPNFKGIKFTENNVVEFQKLNSAHEDLDVFFGVDEAFISSLALNAKGWVGSTYNHLSPLYHAIEKAFSDGDIIKANKLQTLAISFVETLAGLGGFNGAGKSFMKSLGLDMGPSRYPHTTLSDGQLQEVRKKLEDMGLSNYFSK